MRGRMVAAFVAGVLCTVLIAGAALGVAGVFGDDAQARGGGTWQVAGGDDGFAIADWGTGRGESQSLDEWIESMPDTCDIQTIPRGVMFVSVYYRCP